MSDKSRRPVVTCHDYRQEMLLLALRRRLAADELAATERQELQREVERLEAAVGLA
jgi:hypothetical protein